MRHISTKEKNKIIMNANIFRQKRSFMPLFLMTALLLSMMAPSLSSGAEKKTKPQAQAKPQAVPVQKDIVVNDANLQTYQKRVEDLVKKGDFDNSLKIMLKIHDYTKEVLSTVKAIKTQYEKAVNDPSVSQNDKEDLFIKLKGLNQLIPRYTTLYDAATFNLGYIYGKLGETEKARKYLVEFLQITPYSGNRDSQWIKAKTLLLELYSLEGEF
jgi:tetratricopeptide (TPR) repeat protein